MPMILPSSASARRTAGRRLPCVQALALTTPKNLSPLPLVVGAAVETRSCFIHHQPAITQGGPMQLRDGLACSFIACHLDKAIAFAPVTGTIRHYEGIHHFTKPSKQVCQLGIIHRIRQVTDIDAPGHVSLPFPQKRLRTQPEPLERPAQSPQGLDPLLCFLTLLLGACTAEGSGCPLPYPGPLETLTSAGRR